MAMDRDLFRQQYDFELEQRNSLSSATNSPIVAITVVASATSVVLLDYQYKSVFQTYLFVGLVCLDLLSITFAVWCLFRSFWNYEYQKIPSSPALKKHYDELLGWHQGQVGAAEDPKEHADADFLSYLNSRLAEASDWNGQNNIVRGNYLHLATAGVAIAVAMLLPAGLIYVYNKATADNKIHQVHLVNIPSSIQPSATHQEAQMSNQPSGSGNKPAAAPAAAPAAPATPAAPAPAAKPAGPPNTVFKSNTDLVKPSAGGTPLKK